MTKSIFEYKPEQIKVTRQTPKGVDWESSVGDGAAFEPVPAVDIPVRQYWPWRILFTLVALVLVGRLFQLEVIAGRQYRTLAEGNSVRAVQLPASRGLVFDANGKLLTLNTKRVVASLTLERLPSEPTKLNQLLQTINQILPLPAAMQKEVSDLVKNTTSGEYILSQALTKQQTLLLTELSTSIPSLTLQERAIRQYETGNGLAHILGYVGQVTEDDLKNAAYSRVDQVGKAGLEKSYETQLRGTPGVQMMEVDAQGQTVGTIASDRNQPPVTGDSLRLAINYDWQQKIAAALTDAMNKRNQQFPQAASLGGTVIVMETGTGRVKSLVSLPDYDNNLFAKGISQADLTRLLNDPAMPLFCRATEGLYPPGSTIKPLVATGALHFNIVSPSYSVDTPPEINVGGSVFPDWKDHGVTDIRTAIAESNNIFFYMLGGGWNNVTGLGLDRLRQTVHWFGIERPTGIDLPGEESGYYLSTERKQELQKEPVYLGDVYHVSIGQGDIGVTPIQMATATSAIANGGTLYAPHLVQSYVDDTNGNSRDLAPAVTGTIPVSGTDLQIVREGMRQAVLSGSSRPLNTLSVHLAGKTGTAQFGGDKLTHAWFSGFGPFENPQYEITILVEGGGESFDAAVPLAEQVFRIIFNEPAPVVATPAPAPVATPAVKIIGAAP